MLQLADRLTNLKRWLAGGDDVLQLAERSAARREVIGWTTHQLSHALLVLAVVSQAREESVGVYAHSVWVIINLLILFIYYYYLNLLLLFILLFYVNNNFFLVGRDMLTHIKSLTAEKKPPFRWYISYKSIKINMSPPPGPSPFSLVKENGDEPWRYKLLHFCHDLINI